MRTVLRTNKLTDYQIKELQNNWRELNDKVDLIMTNHLPHIKEDIISLKTRINMMTAVNIVGIILGLVAAKLIK